MKTKITLLVTLILFLNYSFAQDYCATPTNNPNQNFSSLSRMINGNSANEKMICLNIFFHIVRNNNGSGGIRDYETNGIIDNLNGHFNPHNIKFNKLGQDSINNTALNDIQASEISILFGINNNPNAINFYIVDSAYFNGFSESIPGKNLIITTAAATTDVSSHEIGHCLNLWHTHHGHPIAEPYSSDPNICEELIDGSNSSICGDYIEDTPADPGLRYGDGTHKVDSNCNYILNDGYNPDTENIMSYTSPTCLRHFTNQQGIRMRDAISNAPILQPVINCVCSDKSILGKSTICSSNTTTYTMLSCDPASFTSSSNLQTISTTNNSITVKPINTSINDEAFVKTIINGVIYQKDIWIGKPKVNLELNPIINFIELELIGLNSDIHKQNITYIEWETLSTTGIATMGTAINQFNNIAHGNSSNWIINARIKVENDCGITYLYKDITPPAPFCDDYYTITKTQENEFIAYLIIDPCDNLVTNSNTSTIKNDNKKEKVKDEDITEAVLFDIYGQQVRGYKSNNFNTNGLKHGIYIFKIQIKDKLITKKVLVE